MKKIALSGAGGQLGSVVRTALIARGVPLRSAGGSRPLPPLVDGEDVMHGDLRDGAVVDRLLEGVDVLIHFAGTSVELLLTFFLVFAIFGASRDGSDGKAVALPAGLVLVAGTLVAGPLT